MLPATIVSVELILCFNCYARRLLLHAFSMPRQFLQLHTSPYDTSYIIIKRQPSFCIHPNNSNKHIWFDFQSKQLQTAENHLKWCVIICCSAPVLPATCTTCTFVVSARCLACINYNLRKCNITLHGDGLVPSRDSFSLPNVFQMLNYIRSLV